MECSISQFKGLLKEGSFGSKLIDILETTKYVGLSAYTGSTRRLTALNCYDSFEKMRPFIEWFSFCVTKDNCLTSDELQIYKTLKTNGSLVPEENLDYQINAFCEESSPDLFLDYELYFDVANKELQCLESLDNFLSKIEKTTDTKTQGPALDVEALIRSELEEFKKLNKNMNEALENFAIAWEELRKIFSQNEGDPKKFSEDSIKKINNLAYCIEKNLNYHLKNDFKEVKPSDGRIDISFEEYWIIFNKFTEVRDEIINVVATTEGLILFRKKIMKLKQASSSSALSLNDIREVIHDENNLNIFQGILTDCLQEEINSISSLDLLDKKCCSALLEDRLDRLSKLEDILQQKKAYIHVFYFIIKCSKVVQDFQLKKLNEFLEEIQLDITTFQQRMDNLSTYMPKKDKGIDSNFKTMINILNIKHPDLHLLDERIAALQGDIKKIDALINSNFLSLEQSVIKRLMSIEKRIDILIDGPTREAFSEIFNKFMAPLELACKIQEVRKNKVSKIRIKFMEMQTNENSKNDCLWMKCLNNPVEFVNSVFEMEEKVLEITKENEILMSANFK